MERRKYRVASAISRSNHNLSCGTCKMSFTTRRDRAECNVKRHAGWQLTPSICPMKVECRGAIANARAPKASKIPTASERGAESDVAHKWAGWLHNPCHLGGGGVPTASQRGAESEVAHKWAGWLHNPCRLGDPHRFAAWGIPTASERGAESASTMAAVRSGKTYLFGIFIFLLSKLLGRKINLFLYQVIYLVKNPSPEEKLSK